jgi:hypothetical protein
MQEAMQEAIQEGAAGFSCRVYVRAAALWKCEVHPAYAT